LTKFDQKYSTPQNASQHRAKGQESRFYEETQGVEAKTGDFREKLHP